jgi:hypothetical protein
MTAQLRRADRNPRAQPARLTDADILEAIEGAYEYAVWAADIGRVDFDAFAELAKVIRELRDRRAAAP